MKNTLPAPFPQWDYPKPTHSLRRKAASVFGVIVATVAMPLITSAAPGPVTQLLWTTQPGQALINGPFGQQPVLVTADANGNPSTNALAPSIPVTISLVSLGGSGTLVGGPQTFDIGSGPGNSNGVCNFANLEIDQTGGYILQAVTGTGYGANSPTNGLSNCILWLDAADTNTFDMATNGITTWADKSGTTNNAVLETTTGAVPETGSLLSTAPNAWGNQRTVGFTGSTYYNVSLQPLLESTFTIISLEVFGGSTNNSNTGTGGGILIGNAYDGVDGTLGFGYRNSTQFTIQQYADDINYTSSNPWSNDIAPRLWTGILDQNHNQYIYLNSGGPGSYVATRAASSLLVAMGQGTVGEGGGGAAYTGQIAEMVVYNTNLTDVQRQSVEGYLLNKWEGQFSFTASTAAFTVAPNAGSVVKGIYFSQQPTLTVAGQTITPSVVVTLTNASGTAVSGVQVSMSLLNGAGPLSGTLLQTSDNNGHATFNDLSFTAEGGKQLQAQVPGSATNNSAPFLITNAPASQLVILTEPSATATAGVPFAIQPVVAVEDTYGNIVSNVVDTIVVFNGFPGNINATSTNGVSFQVTNGEVLFTGLFITNDVTDGSLYFGDNIGFTIESGSPYITVTGAGPSSMLVTTEPSTNGNIGVAFPTQPAVAVYDVYGNFASNGTVVTVSGGPVFLLGPTNTVVVNGVATFAGLNATNLGSVTLTFTSGPASAVSTPVLVEGGPAISVFWATQPGGAAVGSPLGQQPVLKTCDAGENLSTLDLAATNWVSVSLEAGGQLVGGPLLFNIGTTGSNGVATFQNLQVNQSMTNAVLEAKVYGTQLSPTNGMTNCLLWLDAADTSTYQLSSTGTLTNWLDKSGTGNNATNSGTALAPSNSTALSSLGWGQQRAITFSNNHHFNVSLTNANTNLSMVSNTWTIIAMEVAAGNTTATSQYFVQNSYDGVDGTLGFGYRNSTQFTIQQYADDINYTQSGGWLPIQPRLWTGIVDNTNSWHQHIYLNGAPVAIRTSTGPLLAMARPQEIGAGYYGALAEIAIYATNLTDLQRSNVESYLTTKWTQASLALSTPFVVYPADPSLSIVGPVSAGANGNAGSSVTVDLAGIPGRSYRLQTTTNLASTNWISIGTNTAATNGSIQFTDPGATNYPTRFYRAVSP